VGAWLAGAAILASQTVVLWPAPLCAEAYNGLAAGVNSSIHGPLFMHVFAVAVDIPDLTPERLSAALAHGAREFRLDLSTSWNTKSRTGKILAAGVHHGKAGRPRRYLASTSGMVTLFDGLPVDPDGQHAAYDAYVLAAGWDSWADRLEGQFAAAQIDLESEHAEIRLDSFGLVPVFVARKNGGALASTSIRVIQSLLGLEAPDAIGVSALMGTGSILDRTLVEGIVPLEGGAVHRLGGGLIATRSIFGPDSIAKGPGKTLSVSELATQMTRLTVSATRDVEPVQCPITAGRDSRVLVALLLAGGVNADFYTAGRSGDPDVDISVDLARCFGLPHRVIVPGGRETPIDGVEAAARYIEQNEGLSTLLQLVDYIELIDTSPQIGLKLWGAGGEVGRCGGLAVAIANLPVAGRFPGLQRWALGKSFTGHGLDYMTHRGVALLNGHLDRFFEERSNEGWMTKELTESLFAFAGPGWGQGDPRRAAGVDDLFSPFRSRLFTEYCLALTPAERYVEAPHHRLLTQLSPMLREFPYEFPFPEPRPTLASGKAMREICLLVQRRFGLVSRAKTAGGGEWFMPAWIEDNIDVLRDLFEPADSPLWEWIARERIMPLVRGCAQDRAPHVASLLRAATIFWLFSGPRPRPTTTQL
jgi:asparagine synthase (glutamine-hydrolysing)